MKNTKFRFISLLIALPLILTGCGGGRRASYNSNSTSQSGGSSNTSSTISSQEGVTGVTIVNPGTSQVLDGTKLTLRATVSGGNASQRVIWNSSNLTVARVSSSGVVSFLPVAAPTNVTITATSAENNQYSDSVSFVVNHSPFNLEKSRGNPDSSSYFNDGSFIIEDPQDIALVYSDVYATRWYVEATITLCGFAPTEAYSKFGIMASNRNDGMWSYERSSQCFYYLDCVSSQQSWNYFNVVTENSEKSDWDWGNTLSPTSLATPAQKGVPFKMGLMRDGNTFYQFFGHANDIRLSCIGSFEYNGFGNNANYVWIGGWGAAATISNPTFLLEDQVDTLYSVPSGLSLKETEKTLYLGDTYQIEVIADGLWDRKKLTFRSNDSTIATVSDKGLVTAASSKTGTTTIIVGMQDTVLNAMFTVNVTNDSTINVVLDGEMNDPIWSERVKANNYLLRKNDTNYVRIYGAKNVKGLYLFMEYVVSQLKTNEPGQWWMWENVEFRLADGRKQWSGQYWVSSIDGGRFVSVGSGEKREQIYYKPIVYQQDALFHGAFEMFIPYGDDMLTKDQPTYACFGFNPQAGWQSGDNWCVNPIPDNSLQITEDGFTTSGASCDEGHSFTDWIVDTPATCSSTGSAHRDCTRCGERETEVLEIDPNAHQLDLDNATVTVVPTCSTKGLATATCKLCGAQVEVELPYDRTNHSDPDYPGTHDVCDGCGAGGYYKDSYGVIFDGEMNDAIWTQKVKTNSYLLKKNASNYVRIYGTKNDSGLYLFMDYTVAEVNSNVEDQWWAWENVEFRLANDNKSWSNQYYVSAMNNGTFMSLYTELSIIDPSGVSTYTREELGYYNELIRGADNLYHCAFEMFLPYGRDGLTSGQATYAKFGFNSKAGWQASNNWDLTLNDNSLNITADGFAHDGTSCYEGHTYSDWVIDTPATCGSAGSKHHVCSYCGHTETETIPVDSNGHDYDYEHAVVSTPSTCSTHGVGVVTCKNCGATETVELPLDPTNHGDPDYPATHGYCHGCGVGDHLANDSGDEYDHNFADPWNKNYWYDMGVFEGDFKVEFEFNMRGCLGVDGSDWGNYCWRTVLPFVYKEGYAGDADGHFFRMDWCGFGGDSLFDSVDHGTAPEDLYPDCYSLFSDLDVELTITRVGANISLDWVWISKTTEDRFAGRVINYHQGCVLKDANMRVGIALSAEYTTLTITKALVTRI